MIVLQTLLFAFGVQWTSGLYALSVESMLGTGKGIIRDKAQSEQVLGALSRNGERQIAFPPATPRGFPLGQDLDNLSHKALHFLP